MLYIYQNKTTKELEAFTSSKEDSNLVLLKAHEETEEKKEKHVPVVKIENGVVDVNVGSVSHPMEDAHFIGNIFIHTNLGIRHFVLKPNTEPHVTYKLLDGEKVIEVYEFCNLHGLWVKVI